MAALPTPDAERIAALRRTFRTFAERECRGVSPLYEGLALGVAENDRLLALADEARPGQPRANMLLGAVHALLLEEPAQPGLADHYPDLRPDPLSSETAFPAFRAFCIEHAAALRRILRTRVVGTNEPARAACLMPAFGLAAARWGEPLHLVEVGASAGLLLLWDRFAYDYGDGLRHGPANSALTLRCETRGPAPPPIPVAFPAVATRLGIDRHPPDPGDADDRAWLRALVWPEQRARAARLEAALALASLQPPPVRRGDETELLATAADELPDTGVLCITHAFTLNQFDAPARSALLGLLNRIGVRRPTVRIGLEWGDGPVPLLTLQRHGAQSEPAQPLAECDPHRAWIRWRP
jgi:hypothetical protein